jgi:uncharacterized membrane protein
VIEAVLVLVILGAGTVAGVFFAVAVSVMPAMGALPMTPYIQMHRLLGKGYHPVMPALVTVATTGDILLAVVAPSAATRVLFIAAALFFFGVMYVSEYRNVPINKVVAAVDADNLPHDWPDPRKRWHDWHLVRTAFAFTVLALNTIAAVLR